MHIYCCHDCGHRWSRCGPLEECPNCGGANGQPVCRECLEALLGESRLYFGRHLTTLCLLCRKDRVDLHRPGIVFSWPPPFYGMAVCAECAAEHTLLQTRRPKLFRLLLEALA
jgi:hypothetical protein